jgi:arylsulfatase A-like enzyme
MRSWPPLSLILACTLLLAIGGGCQSAEPDRPNVVLIYADDLGYGDLSSYGATELTTPHLDTLARQGLRFANAYASAATCTPSRYSLLTGRYAFRKEGASILPSDAGLVIDTTRTTLASMLNDAGYATGIIGKWHLGLGHDSVNWNERIAPGPLELGFDRSFIVPATNDRVPTVYVKGHHVYNLSEGDPPLRVRYDEKIGDLPTGLSHPEKLRYPADSQHSGTIVNGISRIGWMVGGQSAWWSDAKMASTFLQRARQFVEDTKDRPSFLFLPLHDVHVPRWPAKQFRGESGTGLRGGAIKQIDWVVGQVRMTLRRLDLAKNTLVLFTSDNGPVYDDGYDDGAVANADGHDANGPLRGGKYQSFEEGIRVPFIAH